MEALSEASSGSNSEGVGCSEFNSFRVGKGSKRSFHRVAHGVIHIQSLWDSEMWSINRFGKCQPISSIQHI